MLFGDRQALLEFVTEVGGVDHRRVVVDRIGEFLRGVHQNQFCTGQPDGAVEGASAPDHDYFMFQASRVGKLPDVLIVGAGHASGGCSCHGACGTGSDDAGFGASQVRQALADCALQLQHIDKMFCRFELGLANFREFERST